MRSWIATISAGSKNPFGLSGWGGSSRIGRIAPISANVPLTAEVPLRCMPSTRTQVRLATLSLAMSSLATVPDWAHGRSTRSMCSALSLRGPTTSPVKLTKSGSRRKRPVWREMGYLLYRHVPKTGDSSVINSVRNLNDKQTIAFDCEALTNEGYWLLYRASVIGLPPSACRSMISESRWKSDL